MISRAGEATPKNPAAAGLDRTPRADPYAVGVRSILPTRLDPVFFQPAHRRSPSVSGEWMIKFEV